MLKRLAVVVAAFALAAGAAVTLASSSSAENPPAFEATFDNAGDFAAQFDHGYSGMESWNFSDGVSTWTGDHDTSSTPTTTCGSPSTLRDVHLTGSGPNVDTSELFWWCAPTGAGSGHLMTGVVSVGNNVAWFSPKQTFTAVSKVCWDINETEESHRKWTDVLFVGSADAVRYPTGTPIPNGYARGSGGYDLGFETPEFQDPNGPTNFILPQGGTLAGVEIRQNAPSWFQNQSNFTTVYDGPGNILNGITDKATRYTQCIEQTAPGTITFTQATPGGTRTFPLAGTIPQDARRVVFHDATYNSPKDDAFQADVNTWHWDNIQIFAGSSPPPSTTQAPTTTAATTTAPTTTVASTTTTAATTTTTTIAPIPACPAGFTTAQRNWCLAVNAHIAALEAKGH